MNVKVLTDSTSYIDKNIKSNLDIKTVSLNVKFDKENFRETDIDNNNFYKMMDEKGIPFSSQPSVSEIYNEMKSIAAVGDELLCIFISSDMSGTYSTAYMVKKMILEKYKNAKIKILDSRSNSMQLGFAVIAAAKAAKEGKTLDEVSKVAEKIFKTSRFLFIPENLEYLRKGGRIGGASALIGNLLKIIPILTVEDGKTTVLAKVRTKKKAVLAMLDKMFEDIENYGLGEIIVHHINCYDEAIQLASLIEQKLQIRVNICDIGPVIGVHVGPGAIGVVYYTQKKLR